MDKKEKNKSLIKKADSLTKFDPQKKKELIVRGLKETELQKIILLVDKNEHIHRLYDEEFSDAFDNKIKLVHFNSPNDAFNYLMSNKVHLVFSGIFYPDMIGITFLEACKTLYPELPFIMNSTLDYREEFFIETFPDAFIVVSSDLSELISTIRKLLNSRISTEDYNSKIEAGNSDALFNAGKSNYLLGKYEKALEFFNDTILKKPDDGNVYIYIGCCYERLGMFENAVEADLQALKIKPDYALAYFNLGIHYERLGKHKEAIEAYRHAIEIKPDDADAHFRVGYAYNKVGMYKEAISAYQQAIRIKPDFVYAHNNLGFAYLKLKKYEEAINAFKSAIRIEPNFAKAYCNMGNAYSILARHAEAIEAYNQAIKIEPTYAIVHYHLGVNYISVGQKTKTIEEYQILKKLDPELAENLFNEIYK